MYHNDNAYTDALELVLAGGEDRKDRTGVGTRSVFGLRLTFDNDGYFPILTTKKVHFKSVVGELLWMLSGSTNVAELRGKYGVTIWDEWADDNGNLGPIYSTQWRDAFWSDGDGATFQVDQMQNLIDGIKADPYSRRHIVNSWNVGQIDQMALPPCHTMFQVYVRTNGKLDLQLYQRSSDMFLGLPFNIAQYALLQRIIADQTGYKSGELHIAIGDAHIYSNHFDQVSEQLSRRPRGNPKLLQVMPSAGIDQYTPDTFILEGYDPHTAIKAPVAV